MAKYKVVNNFEHGDNPSNVINKYFVFGDGAYFKPSKAVVGASYTVLKTDIYATTVYSGALIDVYEEDNKRYLTKNDINPNLIDTILSNGKNSFRVCNISIYPNSVEFTSAGGSCIHVGLNELNNWWFVE